MLKNSYFYVIASFVLALFFSLLSMRVVYKSDLDNNRESFVKEADRQSILLSLLIEKDIDFIGAGANFYQSGSKQDWLQFPLFASSLLSSSEGLMSLQWMQKVQEDEIEQHTKSVQKVFPSFKLYTVPKDQPKTFGYVMKDHQPIYVATDIYPRDEVNIPLLGFYSSRERFQLVLDEFIKTGRPSVSDKVRLLQDSLKQNAPKTGMLVYHPVFTTDKQNIKGVMIGVLRISNYFERLISSTSLGKSLVVRIIDTGFDAEDDPVMFQSKLWDDFSGFIYTNSINIENRIWQIEYKTNEKLTDYQRLTLFLMFIGSLAISVLIAALIFMVTRDKYRIEKQLAIRTKELHYLAMHDDLSGLLNRRAIRDIIRDNIEEKTSFALLCFDIDNFKQINDTYGHPEGHKVLCHISQLVSEYLDESASFSRLGGDEFSVVVKIETIEALTKISNDIHHVVAKSPTQFDGFDIKQTISLGAALWKGETTEGLIKVTDQALYQSKMKGRNQVTIHD
ncbi:sensor domain-containing diguanylate cyclase [Aliivibrio sp. S3MY1]|uniref:sensor domain-containing diguanylate cyclase n=1 Tax=unclassified Aliivibrio TaxID=2645654 RepID=UPI002379061D|nr:MULTISPECIES: sensor domain-containing diguanylate cyclase [unclassified Aliivibrio]MDD9196288.1 sensor domain-containing diguanylate cyclase [Aliivibrio sp. S3MY1]MDD9200056.1 sensor domain-containing diguanylate cyclase [Aliivibrio sp. S2MY1]